MIRILMTRIQTNQFAILSDAAVVGDFKVDIEIGWKQSAEQKSIGLDASFTFYNKDERFMLLSISCEFGIHPEDWENAKDGDTITIPRQALEYFAVQTIGTARGILHCKTEGTQFNNVIIPSINVKGIVPDQMTVKDNS